MDSLLKQVQQLDTEKRAAVADKKMIEGKLAAQVKATEEAAAKARSSDEEVRVLKKSTAELAARVEQMGKELSAMAANAASAATMVRCPSRALRRALSPHAPPWHWQLSVDAALPLCAPHPYDGP